MREILRFSLIFSVVSAVASLGFAQAKQTTKAAKSEKVAAPSTSPAAAATPATPAAPAAPVAPAATTPATPVAALPATTPAGPAATPATPAQGAGTSTAPVTPPPAADASAPPPSAAEPIRALGPAAGGADVAVSTCTPTCRSSFMCVSGQCVSACNPICGAGERCTAQGECVPTSPSTLSFFEHIPPKPPVLESGVHQHDGFLFRVALGAGGGAGTRRGVDSVGTNHKTELTGAVTTFSIDVGTTPNDNLVLLLRAAEISLRQPAVKVDGTELSSRAGAWTGAGFFGPGATYYLMPANVYFTGAAGISWVRERQPNDSRAHTTDTGIGLNVDIGKDWWVDTQWGIGIAGRLWYTRVDDRAAFDHVVYEVAGGTLLFSATYQ